MIKNLRLNTIQSTRNDYDEPNVQKSIGVPEDFGPEKVHQAIEERVHQLSKRSTYKS